jgi:hypothetical protein
VKKGRRLQQQVGGGQLTFACLREGEQSGGPGTLPAMSSLRHVRPFSVIGRARWGRGKKNRGVPEKEAAVKAEEPSLRYARGGKAPPADQLPARRCRTGRLLMPALAGDRSFVQ